MRQEGPVEGRRGMLPTCGCRQPAMWARADDQLRVLRSAVEGSAVVRDQLLAANSIDALKAAPRSAAAACRSGAIRGTWSRVIRPLGPDTDKAAANGRSLIGTATQRTPSSCSPSSTA